MVSDYARLAATERELARAAAQRARAARLESVDAAFYDTAMEMVRRAEEDERAAQSHLDAAREYDRLAAEGPASVATALAEHPAEPSAIEESASVPVGEPERTSEGSEKVPVEEQRGRFFDYSRDMLCTAGFDGYFKLLNDAWERTLGYTKEELPSRPYLDFVHPADIERTMAEAASLGTAGADTVQFRNRYRSKDGSYRWLEWNSRADMGSELIYAVARDVTDQQRAAEAEARLSAIVRSSADAIIGLSPQGTVTSWNPAAERLYGYSVDEVIGEPLTKLIPPDRADEQRMLLDRVQAGDTIEHFETRRRRQDGTEFDASLSMSQVLDAQGRIVGASISVREIKHDQ
jgi:PAS domain S-box-containing protein